MTGRGLLALDLGTRCGWALCERGRIEHGVQVFEVRRGESPGFRYLRFTRWLEDLGRVGLDLVVYEQTHQRGGAATEVAAGFATRVQEFCARRGVEHAAVHSATLKKWTTGKGNADKAGMRAAVARRWQAVESDDEADAVALLHFALDTLVPAPADRPLTAARAGSER